ncbi:MULTISPECIES: hypothetical protein [unclassified Nostoc]|uniref:hypothetical protein n=1 Tax=unclassified Nostoc TaxID=2593658 RepID=UPI002AD4AF99|nr:hypothetical protein [Nostoc sp. DedQUE03]MDZ7973462.1 hypothetical protein [Nostoc sp. DedQUE03]MDZ8045078.1 hypothetical protein [Nostoc sp. DedQUE02]
MLNILIIVTIEQLTIIFDEQCVSRIPFENSENLEFTLMEKGRSLLAFPLGRRQRGEEQRENSISMQMQKLER